VIALLESALKEGVFLMLPNLQPDPTQPLVDVQQTTLSYDLLGRYVCNTRDEVINNGGLPFDAVVIGSGMFGGYCAEKIYRFGESLGLRVLVLDAGAFLVPTHLQNLPHITLFAPPGAIVRNNIEDPGPRNTVWGYPWHSNAAFPGLAYCIGGRSVFWGGWSPRLTADDLKQKQWQGALNTYLTTGALRTVYEQIEDEIGVTQPANYMQTGFGTAISNAFTSAVSTIDTTAISAGQPPLGLKVENAPLAVQGTPPQGALFSFDKYSTANLLIDAIREDSTRQWTFNDNSRRRLMVLPRAHVVKLHTDGTSAVKRIEMYINNQQQFLSVGQELAANCKIVLAAGTIESTHLALTSFPAKGMGANLMAHLRSNTTVRIKRSVFGLPAKQTTLETTALLVRGSANISGKRRQFHLQVTVAPSPTPDTESNLFTAIPDIDHLQQLQASQDPEWVVIIFRGIGEMIGDQNVADPAGFSNPNTSWINLTTNADQIETFGKGTPQEQGFQRAWVNLVKTTDDDTFWKAMDDAATTLAKQLAGGNADNIQYFYDGSWQKKEPPPSTNNLPNNPNNKVRDPLGSTHHEAGTLWMGSDPKDSVTDLNGRFHGIDNVYVAGPALFPTLGSANPSLTALALARKTADAIVQALTPAPDTINFKPLFTGSLQGWQMAGSGGFRVIPDVTGAILESTGGFGLLWYTREEFGDFVLTLEWRVFAKDDNSGVFIRFPALNSSSPQTDWQLAVARGYEIQIDDTGYNPDTNKQGDPTHKTGAIYSFAAPSADAAVTPGSGQWNTYEIQAQGDKINVTLNGQHIITDFTVDSIRPLRGHIGVQNHSTAQKTSRVQFRNIRIQSR
jgi:choline dehydrogenase-like flavoprotein